MKKATLTLIFPLDFLHTHTKPEDFPIFTYLMMLRPTKIQTVEWICLDPLLALVVKNPPANAGDVREEGSIPWLGRSPGGGHGNPLQYSFWRIPWMEELDRLWGRMGSQRVRYNRGNLHMPVTDILAQREKENYSVTITMSKPQTRPSLPIKQKKQHSGRQYNTG